jgi:hypothetical protein
LQRHADVLVGSRLVVSGTWRGESFTGKDGQKVAYDVLVLETAEGAGFTFPPDSVAPAPLVGPADAERDAELDALPW